MDSEIYDNPVLKGVVEDLVNGFGFFINDEELKFLITGLINKSYVEGLDSAEVSFNMNFVPDYRAVSFIERFGFDNVKDLTSGLRESLRKELSMGLMNGESIGALKKRVRDVFDVSVGRAKMIALTESNRAFNQGYFQGAKDSGLELMKRWDAQPERVSRAGNVVPCRVCESLDGQVVGLDDFFVDVDGNKYLLPPIHPHCACKTVYLQKE